MVSVIRNNLSLSHTHATSIACFTRGDLYGRVDLSLSLSTSIACFTQGTSTIGVANEPCPNTIYQDRTLKAQPTPVPLLDMSPDVHCKVHRATEPILICNFL